MNPTDGAFDQSREESSSPRVSVIIPAYNAQATLRDTLLSAAASTYTNIEIIVVDDGSTDRTAEIAEEFATRDDRVKLHRRAQGGISAAFNSGFRIARGDYVSRLDSDDLWHPTKIEKQLALAAAVPDSAFIYTFVRYIDSGSRVARDVAPQEFPQRALCRGIYESLVGGNSSAMMRRSVVAELGGYDETLPSWEDLLLQLRISTRHPIAFVPEYLVGYRVRTGSLSSNVVGMLKSWREARARIQAQFPEVPSFVQRWAHGKRCIEFAERFAWEGCYDASARLLAEALANDPERTRRLLTYRTARYVRKRLRQVPDETPGPPFLTCKPTETVRLNAYDAGLEGRRLRALEAQRIEVLRELDERLLGAASETHK